jgi:hypothetical protein
MGVGPGRSEPASNCRNCRNYWNLFEIAGEFPAASSRQGELVALLWPPTIRKTSQQPSRRKTLSGRLR